MFIRALLATAALSALVFALGCDGATTSTEPEPPATSPAVEVGEVVEETTQQAEQAMDEAAQQMEQTAEEVGQQMEQAAQEAQTQAEQMMGRAAEMMQGATQPATAPTE